MNSTPEENERMKMLAELMASKLAMIDKKLSQLVSDSAIINPVIRFAAFLWRNTNGK